MRIYLDNLSPVQTQLANQLWNCDTRHECEDWLASLPEHLYNEAIIVMELMLLASVDAEVDKMICYPEAEAIINQVMNKKET